MWAKNRRLALLDSAVLVLFLFEFVSLSSVQCSQDVWQYAVLYTGEDGSGKPLAIMEDETDNLESLGFSEAKSQCHVGAWVILGSKFSGTFQTAWYLGAVGCDTSTNYKGKAIRFAGDPSNYTRDSLTLFEGKGFLKSKQVLYTDGDVKISAVSSIAATGNLDWTIYKDLNFAGESRCLKFAYGDYHRFFAEFPYDSNIPNDWIKSVRKGCHSSSVINV